jgi:hypothetical protein
VIDCQIDFCDLARLNSQGVSAKVGLSDVVVVVVVMAATESETGTENAEMAVRMVADYLNLNLR